MVSPVMPPIKQWSDPVYPLLVFFLGENHYSYSVYLDYEERPHLYVDYPASEPVSAPPYAGLVPPWGPQWLIFAAH